MSEGEIKVRDHYIFFNLKKKSIIRPPHAINTYITVKKIINCSYWSMALEAKATTAKVSDFTKFWIPKA